MKYVLFDRRIISMLLIVSVLLVSFQSCALNQSTDSDDMQQTTSETAGNIESSETSSLVDLENDDEITPDSGDENVQSFNQVYKDVSPNFTFEDWNAKNSSVSDFDKFDFYMQDYYYYDGYEDEVDFVVKTGKTEDFEYRVLENQKIVIDKYIGKEKRVYVPSQIEGKDVIGIGAFSFTDNKTVRYIHLPDTVVHISWFAFNRCSKLKEVVLPDGLINIGSSAFARCTSLEKINIPDSVIAIGSMTFYYCKSLTELDVSNVTSIGNAAFAECWSLKKVKLSDKLETIESSLFEYCETLSDVNVPKNLKYVYDDSFDYTKVDVNKFYAVAEKLE